MIHQGEKLMIFAKKSNLGVMKIAEAVGMTPQHFARLYKKEVLKSDFLEKFCKIINIDSDVFFFEEKNMFIMNNTPNVKLYDIDAIAGFASNSQQVEMVLEEWYIPILKGDHLAVSVKGSSMESSLYEGDFIVIKKITDPDEIKHNTVYLFIYEGAPLVKRLHLNQGQIELRSDNTFHATIHANRDQITAIFKVVLSIRKH